jgi:hypothetical protein
MARQSQRESDRELIAKAYPWRIQCDGDDVPSTKAASRELNRIAKEVRARAARAKGKR